jgi:hypothetical protein
LLAGAIAFAPWSALAQEAPPSGNTPAADSIGPRELQSFSLNGTVTHAADPPAPVPAAPTKRPARAQAQPSQVTTAPAQPPQTSAAVSEPATAPAPRRTEIASSSAPSAQPQRAPEAIAQSPSSSSLTVALPKLDSDSATGGATQAPTSTANFAPDPSPVGTLAPERRFSMLPWLLAALALALGGVFLFWRNRTREAFAGSPQVDAFVAPVPAQAPRRTPAPPPPAPKPEAPTPSSLGIVSTRLRPWLEIGFRPLRCVLDEERVTIEFELELFNSGSAPARGVLAEATLFNAGPAQDQEIGAFFSAPVGEGERIVAIPPLKRIAMKTQVVAPRSQVQAYELGGHQVFVPVIGFNALYGWSGGEGQTSASYLLGRDTNGEKMGPFRLDLGPRIFRGIAARMLPTGVRN